ncbi:VOC family protein [Elongatibacter sediminis]|uniref:VOC family protein n=1 Tax=Elongatibacter sediminis TaxID=3119006 RepID=A0AAW9R4Q5_9GAMM
MTLAVLTAAPAIAGTEATASVDETVTFFYYDDIDALVPFYEGLLKLEKTMDEDWVKIYRLTPGSSVGLVANGRGLHAVSEDKPAMLSIVTDDVDAWYQRLVSAGVPVVSELPPEDSEAGEGRAPVRGFVVTDPGGYTVEFFTWRKPESSE